MTLWRILRPAGILLPLLLLTGCVQAVVHLTVNRDGSTDMEYRLGMDRTLLAMSADNGANPLNDAATEAKQDGFTVSTYQDGPDVGIRALRHFHAGQNPILPGSAAQALGGDTLGNAAGMTPQITTHNGLFHRTITVHAVVDLTGNDPSAPTSAPADATGLDQAAAAALTGMLDLRFDLTLPVKPVQQNATSVSADGHTLEWTFVPGMVNTVDVTVRIPRVGRMAISGGTALMIVAAGLIAVVTSLRRRNRVALGTVGVASTKGDHEPIL